MWVRVCEKVQESSFGCSKARVNDAHPAQEEFAHQSKDH